MDKTERLPDQGEEVGLEAYPTGLSPNRRSILPMLLLELHVSGFPAAGLCAFQETGGRGAGYSHVHIGVRLTVDPEDQKVRAESWVILMRVRVHKQRLECRGVASLMQGRADGVVYRSVSWCKRRA